MSNDPIIDEIRAVREAYASRFGYDLQAIYDDLKAMEMSFTGRLVELAPRRIDPNDPRAKRRTKTA